MNERFAILRVQQTTKGQNRRDDADKEDWQRRHRPLGAGKFPVGAGARGARSLLQKSDESVQVE